MRRGLNLLVVLVTVCIGTGVLVGQAGAAGTVDQSQTNISTGFAVVGPPDTRAQTFTAGLSGSLVQLDLALVRLGHPGNLNIAVTEVTSSGTPAANVLATGTVAETAVPDGGGAWVSVPLTPPAESVAGMQYAIVVRAPTSDEMSNYWGWGAVLGGYYYADGSEWTSADSGLTWFDPWIGALDWGFQTHVASTTDTTPPTVSVTGVTDGATYPLGGVPTAGCSTTDTDSGVALEASLTVTGGTANGVGIFTATCSGASDNATNTAEPVSARYRVIYDGVTGILQPVNPDNTSIFSRGRTIPVKFQLAGDPSPFGFDTSHWTIQIQAVSGSLFDSAAALIENVSSNTPSTSFRYDATADQYIYNADMRSVTADDYWRFRITLDSGQTFYSAVFKLK